MLMKKIMIAGLLAATMAGGIVPASAQRWDPRRSDSANEANRPSGPQGNWGGIRERGTARPAQPQSQAPVPAAPQAVPEARRDWARERGENRREWRDERRENRQVWRDNRREDRQDWRNDRRDDRRDWRDDRRGDRREWRDDRLGDRKDWRDDNRNGRPDWRDNRNWGDRRDWRDNNSQRWGNYDNRDRWDRYRWSNDWRRDHRYDWHSYRERNRHLYRGRAYYAPRGWHYGYRSFSVGVVLWPGLYGSSYWINDPYRYRLPPAYGSLRWVRYYDDALLVDVRDGYVVDVIRDFFW